MPTINAKSNNQPVWEKETNEKSVRTRGEMIKNKQQQATCDAGPTQRRQRQHYPPIDGLGKVYFFIKRAEGDVREFLSHF